MIPLVDLKLQYHRIEAEVREGFDEVLSNTSFILGPHVRAFEVAYARFIGAGHCLGVANGTDALELALRAVGIGAREGGARDEVIVQANTFIASALAVERAGATPVLVDCEPEHHLIDVAQIESKITERTRAIMPVHLYGQMAPMEELEKLAEKHDLLIIEDAAQSQGASRHGRRAGSVGKAAGTSFYPGKNLGAFGDGGAVTTNDDEVATKVRALRNYGSEVKYHHPETGFNSRLDSLQAVVLSAKLAVLDAWNGERREAAARYQTLLKDLDVVLPGTLEGNEHVWHLYVVRVPNRDQTLKRINEAGIGAGIHYPTCIHQQGAFSHLGLGAGAFPVAEKSASEILSLPLFPGITAEQQEQVAEALRAAL